MKNLKEFFTKYWFIIFVVIVLIVIVAIVVKQGKAKKIPPLSPELQPGTYSVPLDKEKVLKIGSTGNEVKELQKIINKTNAYIIAKGIATSVQAVNVTIDGVFGSKTANSLKFLTGKYEISLADAEFMYQSTIG